jgi:hypothetical protein
MVNGIEIFRERFRQFTGDLTLIGGAACDEWFTAQGLEFRATRDLDIVVMVEKLKPDFIAAMRAFVAEGQYEIGERSEGIPILYRFTKPARKDFPYTLELFSRNSENFDLAEGQKAIPISAELRKHSLSALLLDDDYYGLIQAHHDVRDGLWIANATSLIPLKAHAWRNLTKLKADGETVDSKNITKHRYDVFRLAGTLPGNPGPDLPEKIKGDLIGFLNQFPENSEEWPAILAAIKNTLGGTIRPATLRQAIQTYFRLPPA